jgi:hypothetical protein
MEPKMHKAKEAIAIYLSGRRHMFRCLDCIQREVSDHLPRKVSLAFNDIRINPRPMPGIFHSREDECGLCLKRKEVLFAL